MTDELTETPAPEDDPTCQWIGGCDEEANESGWCDPHEELAESLRQRREADKEIASAAMLETFETGDGGREIAREAERDAASKEATRLRRDPPPPQAPTPGRIVWYETDRRNGLEYYLPAIVNVTADTHPGDYPDGSSNPLPVPDSDTHVHLTVLTPGGYGTTVVETEGPPDDEDFVGSKGIVPGSGTYVELNVPFDPEGGPRTWRWPQIR